MGPEGNHGARLRAFIEEAEAIEAEIAAAKERHRDVFKAAKAAGFDARAMRQIIRERAMDQETRRDWERLCQVYRAALGMLDGTPLGEAARRSFEGGTPERRGGEDAPASAEAARDAREPDADRAPAMPPPPVPEDVGPEDLLKARAQGAAAAMAGRRVTENPFGADDPRRAAWDEGWCAEAGSDGMDIPAAFRRSGTAPRRGRRPTPDQAATPEGGAA